MNMEIFLEGIKKDYSKDSILGMINLKTSNWLSNKWMSGNFMIEHDWYSEYLSEGPQDLIICGMIRHGEIKYNNGKELSIKDSLFIYNKLKKYYGLEH